MPQSIDPLMQTSIPMSPPNYALDLLVSKQKILFVFAVAFDSPVVLLNDDSHREEFHSKHYHDRPKQLMNNNHSQIHH
jgi:hypothetical protein